MMKNEEDECMKKRMSFFFKLWVLKRRWMYEEKDEFFGRKKWRRRNKRL